MDTSEKMTTFPLRVILVLLCVTIESSYCQTNEEQYVNNSCAYPLCSCCLDTVTVCPSDGVCHDQCKDGIFGKKCFRPCPTNCLRCSNHPNHSDYDYTYWNKGYCVDCKDGYYSTTQFYQCQLECPENCQDKICYKDSGACHRCIDGFQGDNCTDPMPVTVEVESLRAVIGWGVAGGLFVIIICLVVIVFLYRRRLGRSHDWQPDGIPTHINDIEATANEARDKEKAIRDKTRKLEEYEQHQLNYQQKEADYAEKVARTQHELNELKRTSNNQDIEEGTNAWAMSPAYESLDPQAAVENPYASIGNN